jgi:photosystem II stability/assembly factor-like uncharacterized protein
MRFAAAFLVITYGLLAQDQPPAAPGPTTSTAPVQPVLENTGKPMLTPFQCTDEDIRSGGLTCTDDDPCPVYLELTAAASSGIRLFTVGNIHTAAATLFSVILGSEDNGHTWRETNDRIRGSGFDSVQFIDAENGWASGLALSPLPQDPFLLKTTDGGKTWRQVPLFNETRYGSILQFHFDDKTSGTLILDHGTGSGPDRYERYESLDGGDSWTVKETSVKPLALKRPPAAPDWRVRADGNSRSFQLEKRNGQRWSPVAGFAVNLGVCKPQQ